MRRHFSILSMPDKGIPDAGCTLCSASGIISSYFISETPSHNLQSGTAEISYCYLVGRRYRLRKKLDLANDANLTEFILRLSPTASVDSIISIGSNQELWYSIWKYLFK